MNISLLNILILFNTIINFSLTLNASPALEFYEEDSFLRSFTKEQLQKEITPVKIRYHDPFYAKTKTYLAIPLDSLFKLGFKTRPIEKTNADKTEFVFEATDGYQAFSTAEFLKSAGGYLAIEDLDQASWELMGENKVNPGPFYIFWSKANQHTAQGFPWPWQLGKIRRVSFLGRYKNLDPGTTNPQSPVFRGHKIFRGQCFRCHAINRQGGKIGPDLHAPQNILSYRNAEFLYKFIKKPSEFRYSKMPDHTHLSDADLQNILTYFRYLKDRDYPQK